MWSDPMAVWDGRPSDEVASCDECALGEDIAYLHQHCDICGRVFTTTYQTHDRLQQHVRLTDREAEERSEARFER